MQPFMKRFWWLFYTKKPVEQQQPRKPTLYELTEELNYKVDLLTKQAEEQASKPGIMLVAPGVSLDANTSDFQPFEESEAPGE